MFEVIQTEALTNLLDRKGIISKQELLEEIKRLSERPSFLRLEIVDERGGGLFANGLLTLRSELYA